MEKHVPKIVASWLAGTFDRDRLVSRVATEGLSSFLTTPEKIIQFWKRCQPQILDYASDAILETADTLSDERSISVDDAEAKYFRVLGSSIALVLNLLQKLDPADLEKHRDSYDKFFEVDKVWTSATVEDTVVRKLSCQLVLGCLEKYPSAIESNVGRLSKVYVSEGMRSNQAGSAADFIRTLLALTTNHSTIWSSDYQGKKSPTSRLKIFLEKGSQGSAATFWDSLAQLFGVLPPGITPTDLDGSIDFMKSLRSGITGREEHRDNAVNAWSCYLSLGRHFIGVLPPGGSAVKFVQETIFPLTEQYLLPIPERAVWASGCQLPVLIKAYTSTATSPTLEVVEASAQLWDRLKDEFKGHLRNSLPEASKDHQRSQKSVADEGKRWFALAGKILEAHAMTLGRERPIPDLPTKPSLELISEVLDILETRNWKPFGAAATIEAAFKTCARLFESQSTSVDEVLAAFEIAIQKSNTTLLSSPSAPYILSSINSLGEIPGREKEFGLIWKASVEGVLSSKENPGTSAALAKLIASKRSASIAAQDDRVQSEIVDRCADCAAGGADASWDLFNAALAFDALNKQSGLELAQKLTALLTKQSSSAVIKSLLLVAQKKPELLSSDETVHMSLMTSLLGLSERSDADPEVSTLRALLSHPSTGQSNIVEIIQQNVNDAGPNSLG